MTTYHVRQYQCIFPSNLGSGGEYCDSTMLRESAKLVNIRKIIPTIGYDDVYFSIAANNDAATYPDYLFSFNIPPLKSAETYTSYSTDYYPLWYDVYLSANTGFNSTKWVSQGWSNPDTSYSTYLNELCTYFENSKDSAYGLDKGTVNLYVFKYKYNDYPSSGWAYSPFFMKGNDTEYDSLIVI